MEDVEGSGIVVSRYIWGIVVLVIVLIIGLMFFTFSGKLMHSEDSCGDETFYGNCSSNKPYFCLQGNLTQNATLCGCPTDFNLVDEKCFSEYNTHPKNVTLSYSFKDENRGINFTLYRGFYDYTKAIPRSIDFLENPNPTMNDFKSKIINNKLQKSFLIPLVIEIQNSAKKRENQAKIAISLVQNIPYDNSDKNVSILSQALSSKYPYEVIYENTGLCGEKSNLLAFLLKELGYEAVIFHFYEENHEAVGIKCSSGDFKETGYCVFDATSEFSEELESFSYPEIVFISDELN